MMRPTTWDEQCVLNNALTEYLKKRAPDALLHEDYSIMEAASTYVDERYGHDNPVRSFKVQRTFDNIKRALGLLASHIHIHDMSQPEEVSSIQKGEAPMPPMQQCTDNDTTMPESKRAILTQAAIAWAKTLGYTLTRLDIDEIIYHMLSNKVAAIKELRNSARPVGITRPFNLITGNGFSDFIDGQGITYTTTSGRIGLKQAKDIVDMLEANLEHNA